MNQNVNVHVVQIERPKVLLASYSKPSAQTRNGPAPLASFEDLPTDDQLSPLEADGRTPTNDPVVDFDELEFDVEPVKQQLNVSSSYNRSISPADTLTPVRSPMDGSGQDWPGSSDEDARRKSSSVSQVTVTEVKVDQPNTEEVLEPVVVRKKSGAGTTAKTSSRKSSLAGFLFGSKDKNEGSTSGHQEEKGRRKSSGILSFLTGKDNVLTKSLRKKSREEHGTGSGNVETILIKNKHFDDLSPEGLIPGDDRSNAYAKVRKQINKSLDRSPSDTNPGESGGDKYYPPERIKAYDVVREQMHVQTVRSRRESDWRPKGMQSPRPESAQSATSADRPPSVQEKLKSPSSSGSVIKEADDRADILDSDDAIEPGHGDDDAFENEQDNRVRAYDQVRKQINRDSEPSPTGPDRQPALSTCEAVFYPEERLKAYEHIRRQINRDLEQSDQVEVVVSDHDEAEDRAKAYGQVRKHVNRDLSVEESVELVVEVNYPEDRLQAYNQVRQRVNRDLSIEEEAIKKEEDVLVHDQGAENAERSQAYGQMRHHVNRELSVDQVSVVEPPKIVEIHDQDNENAERSEAYGQIRDNMYRDTVPSAIPSTVVHVLDSPPQVPAKEGVTSPDMMREIRLCKRKIKKRQDTTDSEVSEVQSLPEILPSSRKIIKKDSPMNETSVINESAIDDDDGAKNVSRADVTSDFDEEESSYADDGDALLVKQKMAKKMILERTPSDDPEMTSLLLVQDSVDGDDLEPSTSESHPVINGSSINNAIKNKLIISDERRGSQVQILSKEERAIIKTLPVDRPRSLTPLTIAPLEEYLRRVSLSPDASSNVSKSGDRIKLSLPGEQFTGSGNSSKQRTPRKSNPQIWQDFCEKGLNLGSPKVQSKIIINANNNEEVVIKTTQDFNDDDDQNDGKVGRSDKDGDGFLSVLSGNLTTNSAGSPVNYDAFSPISDAPLTPITPLDEDNFKSFDDTFDPSKFKPKSLHSSQAKKVIVTSGQINQEDDDDGDEDDLHKECNKCMCFMREKIELLTSPGSSNDAGSPLIERDPEIVESQVLLGPPSTQTVDIVTTSLALETPDAEDIPLMSPNPCPCDCHTVVWRQVERSLSMSKASGRRTSEHVTSSCSKDSLVLSTSSSSTSGSYKCSGDESKSSQVKVSVD